RDRVDVAGEAAVDPFELAVAEAPVRIAEDNEAPGEAGGRHVIGGGFAHRVGNVGVATNDEVRHAVERGHAFGNQGLDLDNRVAGNKMGGELAAHGECQVDGLAFDVAGGFLEGI